MLYRSVPLFFESFWVCLVYGLVFTAFNGKRLLAKPNGVLEPQFGIASIVIPLIGAFIMSSIFSANKCVS